MLARALAKPSNLLVLDEPTNDLDLVTLGVLEDALVNFPGCALVVSHDRWFLDKIATGILAFEGDGRVEFYEGDWSAWHAKRQPSAISSQPSAAEPKRERAKPVAARKLAT